MSQTKKKLKQKAPSTGRPSSPARRWGSPVQEARKIVQAIRRGRVDASVMEGPAAEKIVTLQGADHPYRVLVESVTEGAATLDERGIVLYANRRFAELLNIAVENLIGSSLERSLPARERGKLKKLLGKGRSLTSGLELTLDSGAGGPKSVRFTLKPLRNSSHHKVCVVTTELTELIEANEALKSNEESLRHLSARLLQLQDEERRHIARDLHDITGQKLAFQCMALGGILSKSSSTLDAESQQSLSESLSLNKEISTEIRTLSYLLHPPLLDELGLASAARWYAAGFTKRTGIPIDVEIPPEIKRLNPDAEVAVFRVLQESLTNVHRYSNTAKARLCMYSTDEEIRVEIEDFGKGMQAAKSRSPQQSVERLGVGIQGMTERIRQLGGSLEISSKVGRGTLVVATIPFSASQVAIPVEQPAGSHVSHSSFVETENPVPARLHPRKRILIADDHEMLRRGVRNTLQTELDLEICGEAINGQDAVDKVKELHPDLVILDINMPVLNGLVAVRQILRYKPDTKVVVFSVHNSEQTLQEIHTAGAHGFISKGQDAQDLLRVVRDVLSQKSRSASASAAI